jgi:hypothetical protein
VAQQLPAAIILAASLTTAGCGSTTGAEHPTPASSARPYTVSGSITLGRGQFEWGVNGTSDTACYGRGGYDDLAAGAQVVITDPAGKTVAIGQLRTGTATVGDDQLATSCDLPFTVPNVPAGLGFYGVEVSHRGRVQYPEAQIRGLLSLTI